MTINLFLIFILAGIVKGITGMGLPTVAISLLGYFMLPVEAATLIFIPSFITNIWQMFDGKYFIYLLKKIWLMLIGIIIGTLPGIFLLHFIEPKTSSLFLGFVLIIYVIVNFISPIFNIQKKEKIISLIIGVITGVITGITGIFGMPAAPYLQSLRLDKDLLIQALGISFTISTIILGSGLVLNNLFSLNQLKVSIFCTPSALLGLYIGKVLRNKMNAHIFRKVFLSSLLLSGLNLIIKNI